MSGTEYSGRMNDPDASAGITGACGDTMEFYLNIKDLVIQKVLFHTDGCEHTHKCGNTTARLAEGKSLEDALHISPGLLLSETGPLPEDHVHCAILAVMTFHKAIGDYLVRYHAS